MRESVTRRDSHGSSTNMYRTSATPAKVSTPPTALVSRPSPPLSAGATQKRGKISSIMIADNARPK